MMFLAGTCTVLYVRPPKSSNRLKWDCQLVSQIKCQLAWIVHPNCGHTGVSADYTAALCLRAVYGFYYIGRRKLLTVMGVHILSRAFTSFSCQYMQLIVTHAERWFKEHFQEPFDFPAAAMGPSLEVFLFFFKCHTNWVIRLPYEKNVYRSHLQWCMWLRCHSRRRHIAVILFLYGWRVIAT